MSATESSATPVRPTSPAARGAAGARLRRMAALTVALALALVPAPHVAYLHGGTLVVLDVANRTRHVVLRHAGGGPVGWSGDGRFVSAGGRVAYGPSFPTGELTWAPTGATAAYVT